MRIWMIACALGALAVLQGGINREIARQHGLSSAILLNSTILLCLAGAGFALAYFQPQFFPDWFQARLSPIYWRWWFLLPACCGFALVAGIPAVIPQIGASGTFLAIVVGQMIFSTVWDYFSEQIPLDPLRLAGMALAVLGLILSTWRSLFS